MLDFYIYAFWRGCIFGSLIYLEQLLGDGVHMYKDSLEELVHLFCLGLIHSHSSRKGVRIFWTAMDIWCEMNLSIVAVDVAVFVIRRQRCSLWCNLVQFEELQHGNRGFTLFETKLAGIDTFQPWVQVASFEQSRLVFATWICRNQFLANRICDLFCVTERVWTPYFGGTKIAVNSSVNWVVAVRSCQRCFLWTMPGVDFIVLSDVICLVMTHVNQISSFELRLTHCDERLASEGDKHIQWMCVVCLWFGKKK